MLAFAALHLALAASTDVVAEPPTAPAAVAPADVAAPGAPVAPAQNDDDAKTHADGTDADDADGEAGDAEVEPEAHGEERGLTRDLSDEALREMFEHDPAALGSISVGFAHAGRLIGGATFPRDPRWSVVEPARAYGTTETITAVTAAIAEVAERHPGSPPLRINHLSSKDGGPQKGHRSHQSGRDVDLAFYYPHDDPVRVKKREHVVDVPRTWALVRALVTHGDVQVILLDRRVQAVLKKHAEKSGEDQAWVRGLFEPSAQAIVKHAPRHRDHLHVRYYSPRAQELGRRVQPILALRPEHNVVAHRVQRGETLSRIARRYDSTTALIQKANRVSPRALRAGQTLAIPLRGPCTHCPMPPPVLIPPRRVPPDVLAALAGVAPSPTAPSAAIAAAGEGAPAAVQAASEVLDDELRRVVEAVLAPRETRDTPARGTATPTVAATTTAPSTTATNAFAVAARSSADADCEAGRPLGTRQSPAIR